MPAGRLVVFQVRGLEPYAEVLQVPVTGFRTQSWYSGVPEPPVATALKLMLVPILLDPGGVTEVRCTEVQQPDRTRL